MAKLAQSFDEFLQQPNFSIVLNTEGLFFLEHEPRFREIVRDADLIFCDGIGLKIALQLAGLKTAKRLHGPDLFHNTLHLQDDQKRFILGGSVKSHQMLVAKYPNLANNPNVEFYSEMVSEDDLSHLISAINLYKPDIIYVCLGIRKQEYIGAQLRKVAPESCIVGIGASIDFESGNVKRSSPFFQKIGLEWLPRLIKEPRMIPRMLRSIRGLLSYALAGLVSWDKKDADLLSIVASDTNLNRKKK